MKILLYGGTFDPPHKGHLNNLKHSAELIKPDKVIVMPAGVPPHKRASATPAETRLRLCECFKRLQSSEMPDIEINDWEVQQAARGERNYTVLTLEMLQKEYPDATLYLCVGSDMLLIFTTWYRWQDILRLAHLIVESREAGDALALRVKAKELDPEGTRILFTDAPALPMASHELREKLAAGQDCTDFLPPSVCEMIGEEGIYCQKNIEE